jgi:hypothetical protein
MALDPSTIVALQHKLDKLKLEHRQLDEKIAEISQQPIPDDIQIHRLKKQKLLIKDQIKKIEALLLPDIIA